jgi:hypothetical protein
MRKPLVKCDRCRAAYERTLVHRGGGLAASIVGLLVALATDVVE